jgi:hypothetical protein
MPLRKMVDWFSCQTQQDIPGIVELRFAGLWVGLLIVSDGDKFFSELLFEFSGKKLILEQLLTLLHPGAVLCIAADDGENAPSAAGGTSSAQDILGSAGAGIDLAKAHLELCLKLDKPLCIVITKLDLASKTSLRQTLSKILSAVKAMGRTPSIIPPDQSKTIDSDLTTITVTEEDVIRGVAEKMGLSDGLTSIIPISMSILKFIFSLSEVVQRLPPQIPWVVCTLSYRHQTDTDLGIVKS